MGPLSGGFRSKDHGTHNAFLFFGWNFVLFQLGKILCFKPLEATVGLLFLARLTNDGPRRPRGLDRLMLNSSINSMKWDQPSEDTSDPGPDATQSIIDRWNPFNQRDTSVANMRDLYPTSLHIPIVTLSREYFISFLGYLDKKILLACG